MLSNWPNPALEAQEEIFALSSSCSYLEKGLYTRALADQADFRIHIPGWIASIYHASVDAMDVAFQVSEVSYGKLYYLKSLINLHP